MCTFMVNIHIKFHTLAWLV